MDFLQLKQLKILIVGDSCEDVYHYGSCTRLSPEAPVPVFKEERVHVAPGMSANVRENLKQFGCSVTHITHLEQITKRRFVDSRFKQHLLRVDQGENQQIQPINLDTLPLDVNAVFVSDYNKGFLRHDDCEKICNIYNDKHIPIFVDSKKKDLSCFSGCFVKINEKEDEECTGRPTDSETIITLGPAGAKHKNKVYPTDPVEVFDVSGAGDVFLTVFGLCFLLKADIEHAILIANKCSSRSVTSFGTYVLSKEDINDLCV
jgi:bifunctional ADP-heptose synthase (sugar kinase/adenylyltransferase)